VPDQFTLLEITGFITGIAGILLTLKQKIWCFPVGVINVTISLYLFYLEHLYADAIQQLFYIVLLTYGWYAWLNPGERKEIPITYLKRKNLPLLIIAIFACALTLGATLHKFTNASLPFIDAAATSIAFAAQYLVAGKKIENWLLWIIVNVAYIAIYLYKDLPLYALLSLIYLLLAIAGYRNWKNLLTQAKSR
jgi:nicotinamide mononucleotide transporter